MKSLIISTLIVFGLSATTAYAGTDANADEKVATDGAGAAKSEGKKDEYKVVCRRVKMTGSNRSEKVCKRVSASKSDSKKKK